MYVDLKLLIVLLAVVAVVACADNATTAASASASAGSTTSATPTTTKKPNVLQDIVKTIAALPIGIAEFCKDSAATVEDFFSSIFG